MRRTLRSLAVFLAIAGVSCTSDPAGGRREALPACFGIDCGFSGRLTQDEEASVPEALRGAFAIEAVQDISPTALKELTAEKEQVAEETRGGVRYVALRDYRCVEFEGEVSGMMIVIERYRVRETE